jgi:O-antigen ligase
LVTEEVLELAMLVEARIREKPALPMVAAISMGVLIGGLVGLWGQDIALWLLGAAGLVVFYIALLLKFRWGLLLFLALLPSQYVDLTNGRLGFVLSPTRLILPGLAIGWLIYRFRRRNSEEAAALDYRLLAPLVSLLLLICFSAAFSQNWHASAAALFNLAEVVVVFAILVDVIRTTKLLHQAILAICIAIGIVGFTAAYDFLASPQEWVTRAQLDLEYVRAASIVGHANQAADFVAILFPLLLYALTVSRSRFGTWALSAIALTAVLGVLLTLSRAGSLALLAGVVVSYRRRISTKVILILLVLAIALISTQVSDIWLENIGARSESIAGRLGIWYAGLRSALEFPLLGSGFGTFNHLNKYVSFDWPADLFQKHNLELNKSAHGLYISLLAETGFLSMVFLGVFWWQFLRLLRNLNRHTSLGGMKRQWWLVQFLIGSSAALLVSRLFTTDLFVLAIWVLLGILMSASSIIAQSIDTAYTIGSEL